jgi:small subunit ribosomal protein S1
MTIKVRFKKYREEAGMDVNSEKVLPDPPPAEPDEGWWAAVLADEPLMDSEAERQPPILPAQDAQEKVITGDKTKKSGKIFSGSSVNWNKIRRLFTNDEIIIMRVMSYNRGGVLVSAEDVHGFVPASHLIDIPADVSDDDREQYLTSYLERKISLKVIECDPEKERVVFSERAAQAEEGQRKHLLHTLTEGDVVSGIVTNVTSFGAFVDLGGLEGLIHVSELSWGRVAHPSDVIQVDEEVETIVLQVSEDQCRIALSLKQLTKNPWISLAENLSSGDVVDATITSIVRYGAFARLPEGVEGLIHISSINLPDGCKRLDGYLYEGQTVRVRVLNVDAEKRRLGLKLEEHQE